MAQVVVVELVLVCHSPFLEPPLFTLDLFVQVSLVFAKRKERLE